MFMNGKGTIFYEIARLMTPFALLQFSVAPPARMTSLVTLTVCLCAVCEVANSTEFAVRLSGVDFEANMRRVTVALARMARLDLGGSRSMYAERE